MKISKGHAKAKEKLKQAGAETIPSMDQIFSIDASRGPGLKGAHGLSAILRELPWAPFVGRKPVQPLA